jgi:hypothetical protein
VSAQDTLRLSNKRLPPLPHNFELKSVLREIDERGVLTDDDLDKMLRTAGNVSRDEDRAMRLVVDAFDIEKKTSPDRLGRFMNALTLEADCRKRATLGQWRGALVRSITGGATGLAAAVTAVPALKLEESVTTYLVATFIGLYTGFRTGMASNYGVEN